MSASSIDKIESLQAELKKLGAAGLVLPTQDQFQSEYPPDYAKRLAWLTDFTGSTAAALVLAESYEGKFAVMFVDGRYTIQAAQELDKAHWLVANIGEMAPEQWFAQHMPESAKLAYDPWLHSIAQVKRWQKPLAERLMPLPENPVDVIWSEGRPQKPAGKVSDHPLQWAGEGADAKLAKLAVQMTQNKADALLLTMPDGINWLFNIRGEDVPFNPLLLCYALVENTGRVRLMVYESQREQLKKWPYLANVELLAIEDVAAKPSIAFGKYTSVMLDPASASQWWADALEKLNICVHESTDPTLLLKACKNNVEIAGTKAAHIRDGLAVTKFLHWVDVHVPAQKVTELQLMDKLEEFRRESNLYRGQSFETIAGSGANGAIVHYRATEASSRVVQKNDMLLVDSGGQYPDGTTDITRTMICGAPTEEMVDRYTRVLKGHIAVARAKFPEGTSGSQLDPFARYHLWQAGLDYDHGTGHGVGSFLCVHEGPQRISKRGTDVPLQAGMILSNEPGYYKTGEYGIRIENLVLVVEIGMCENGKKQLGFETITLAPIDTRLVDAKMLTYPEKKWLNEYHVRVLNAHSESLDAAGRAWLEKACAALT